MINSFDVLIGTTKSIFYLIIIVKIQLYLNVGASSNILEILLIFQIKFLIKSPNLKSL